MRVVRIRILTHTPENHLNLISRLITVFVSHEATYEAPGKYVVTCDVNHVNAERAVDHVVEELGLQSEKKPLGLPETAAPPSAPFQRAA